jgi:predicted porin
MRKLKSTLWGSMLAAVAAVGLIVANPAAAQSEANLYEKAKSEKDLSLYTEVSGRRCRLFSRWLRTSDAAVRD